MSVVSAFYSAQFESVCSRLRDQLGSEYFYHSLAHTLDVIKQAERIGRSEGVNEAEIELLMAAALYHDLGFTISRKDHESNGIVLFLAESESYNLAPEEREAIVGCINATRIPQQPKTLLERIICDADLDYLGREDFKPIAHTLFQELSAFGEVGTLDAWNKIQIQFLSKHRYHTATSQQTRSAQVLFYLAELIDENP